MHLPGCLEEDGGLGVHAGGPHRVFPLPEADGYRRAEGIGILDGYRILEAGDVMCHGYMQEACLETLLHHAQHV